MSATRDSSISVGYFNNSCDDPSVTYVDSVGMSCGSMAGTGDGSAIVIGAEATAFGTDTYVQMTMSAMVADNGSSTTLALSAELVAAAAAAGYDPFASTTIWYVVSGPVDSYILIQEAETLMVTGPVGSLVVQSVSLQFDGVALDADPMSCIDAPPAYLPPCDDGCLPSPDPGCDCGCGDDGGGFPIILDGNVAMFAFQADAFGDDSLAVVNFDALTLEDQMSTITGLVEVAIG